MYMEWEVFTVHVVLNGGPFTKSGVRTTYNDKKGDTNSCNTVLQLRYILYKIVSIAHLHQDTVNSDGFSP